MRAAAPTVVNDQLNGVLSPASVTVALNVVEKASGADGVNVSRRVAGSYVLVPGTDTPPGAVSARAIDVSPGSLLKRPTTVDPVRTDPAPSTGETARAASGASDARVKTGSTK